MKELKLCDFDGLEEKDPLHKLVNGLDLVVIKYGKEGRNQ